MRRGITFAIAAMFAMALLVGIGGGASAHEHRQVLDGKYEIVMGFLVEPAISNEVNSIDLRVSDLSQATPAAAGGEAIGAPVEGLEQTLRAEIIFGDQVRELELEARWGQPGAYNGWVIPVEPGDYSFHVFGTINGESIDEIFTPGPETFSSVDDRSELEFPAADAASQVAPLGVTSSEGDITSSGVGGLAVAGLVAVLGLVALSLRTTRGTRVGCAAVHASSMGD